MNNPAEIKCLFTCTTLSFLLLCSCSMFRRTSEHSYAPEMVQMEGGSFKMGDIFDDGNTDAQPVHKVTLKDFKIGKYEVTYRQYDAFARQTNRRVPPSDSLGRGSRPVVNISWKEAQLFCHFYGWRLPTEQEWEYAARSGGKKMRFAGTHSPDSLDRYARTSSNSAPYSFHVGSKKPNNAGLYDMSGNVYEWIGRYYQFYPKKGKQPNWENMQQRAIRIIRGGSFKEPKKIAATYWRVGILKEARSADIGFRCVDPLKAASTP